MIKYLLIRILIIFTVLFLPAVVIAGQVDSNCSIIGVSGFYAYNNDDPVGELSIFYSFWGWHRPNAFIKKFSLHVDNGYRFKNNDKFYYQVSSAVGLYTFKKVPVGFSAGTVHYSASIKNPDVTSGLSLGVLYTPLVHIGARYMFGQKAPFEFFAGFRFHFYSVDYDTGDWRRIL